MMKENNNNNKGVCTSCIRGTIPTNNDKKSSSYSLSRTSRTRMTIPICIISLILLSIVFLYNNNKYSNNLYEGRKDLVQKFSEESSIFNSINEENNIVDDDDDVYKDYDNDNESNTNSSTGINVIQSKIQQQQYTTTTTTETAETKSLYQPGMQEEFIINNMDKWNWNETNKDRVTSACSIYYNNTNETTTPTTTKLQLSTAMDSNNNKYDNGSNNKTSMVSLSRSLQQYRKELALYNNLVTQFIPVHDIRFQNGNRSATRQSHIQHVQNKETICQQLRPSNNDKTKGLQDFFRSSQGLSSIQHNNNENDNTNNETSSTSTTRVEYIEPLLPPLRHPEFCFHNKKKHLYNMGYLIHDFESICYKQIRTPTSRNVFIDMGASYIFHKKIKNSNNVPSIHLINLFTKFGFPFDHIYAYEMKYNNPIDVYTSLPKQYNSALHWINIPVSTESTEYTFDNPLQLILDNFNEDDLIIVKLDIDTPSVEMSFINQLVQSSSPGTDNSIFTKYSKLIDHFYFEHHVVLQDLLPWWGRGGVNGSLSSSLQLFQQLRKQGIAAHYWP